MLTWYEENGKWLGFDDDYFAYRVAQDKNGWYFEEVQDQDGADGYDTAQEAMEAAEADFQAHQWDYDDEEEEPLTIEEMEEILGDILFEERREARLGW